MSTQKFRTPLQILPTKGYVTVLEGEAGIGKTSLALASALASGKVKYISYNEPEDSLVDKAKRVIHGQPENLEVLHMLSGSNKAFSEIINSMAEGKIVILDSVDAFLWGEGGHQPERALFQLIYESVKIRNGSLVLINEGSSTLSNTLKFVADSYIKMESVKLLGLSARKITVLKDRDYPVSVYPFYYTFSDGLQILNASYFLDLDYIIQKKVKPWNRPFGAKSVMGEPELFLYVMDRSVSVPFSRIYRLWLAVDYLNQGRNLVFMARPDENISKLKNSLETMSGKNGFTVIKSTGRIADDCKLIESYDKTMLIADTIVWEDEAASNQPAYEFAIKELVEHNTARGSGMILFTYGSYTGFKIVDKYATRERRLMETENHIFLRTIRPPGPLYYVKVENSDAPELKLLMMF
ncbi:MAG: RAD55 family ATPase [Nitrososphaeria archaeon]